MRRKFYLGFGLALLAMFGLLLLLHAPRAVLFAISVTILFVILHDLTQKTHAIRRNFPFLGNIRYLLEFIRPEIQQYFIASDTSEKPFDRETRSLIYQRAKNERQTLPFGTHRDLRQSGACWVQHSLKPSDKELIPSRIWIGKDNCEKPYFASLLNISGMSFGALSQNAVIALSRGAKSGQFALNTGEGGLSQYHLDGGCDLTWQIGTGYFGCRNKMGQFDPASFADKAQIDVVKLIEIKLSQGAKPAHGGILPAAKLTPEIADIRQVVLGADVCSPPAHSAFQTPIELCNFIAKIKTLSGGKPVGFKLCLGKRREFLALLKAILETQIYPDFITVDGAEGGTGAAPIEFSNHIGAPLNEALVYVHNTLLATGLRNKIRIIASGKVATGFDMVSKMALGADLCHSARAFMLALGCIQSLQCHTNQCPTGVTTQNPRLMRGLVISDKAQRVTQFHQATIDSFLELLAAMGLNNASDITASDLFLRRENGDVMSYQEHYPSLEEKQFILGDIPMAYLDDWQYASAQHF